MSTEEFAALCIARREAIIADLGVLQQQGIELPMSPEEIAAIEIGGSLVNLDTGEVTKGGANQRPFTVTEKGLVAATEKPSKSSKQRAKKLPVAGAIVADGDDVKVIFPPGLEALLPNYRLVCFGGEVRVYEQMTTEEKQTWRKELREAAISEAKN